MSPLLTPTPTQSTACRLIKTTGVISDRDGCSSVSDIVRTRCRGQCHSEIAFNSPQDGKNPDCTCCKPNHHKEETVELTCPDGSHKQHKYYVFLACSCYSCSSNPLVEINHA